MRPFIEEAKPEHPSLIDREHVVADLYGIINVPTVVWIDEQGTIVRPNDVAFGNDAWKELTGLESAPHLNALRAWVTQGTLPFDPEAARARQMLPTHDEQLARAEFGLAVHLHRKGRKDAAERHFLHGGELSPNDFMVRRGSMPIRGIDPMGSPEFSELYQAWIDRGRPYYEPRGATKDYRSP